MYIFLTMILSHNNNYGGPNGISRGIKIDSYLSIYEITFRYVLFLSCSLSLSRFVFSLEKWGKWKWRAVAVFAAADATCIRINKFKNVSTHLPLFMCMFISFSLDCLRSSIDDMSCCDANKQMKPFLNDPKSLNI